LSVVIVEKYVLLGDRHIAKINRITLGSASRAGNKLRFARICLPHGRCKNPERSQDRRLSSVIRSDQDVELAKVQHECIEGLKMPKLNFSEVRSF